MIQWLARTLGFEHRRGLSDEKRVELARLHAKSRRVLRKSITVRVSLIAAIQSGNNRSHH